MAAEDEVRQASTRFYTALTGLVNGDTGPMSTTWAHGADVTTMHPIRERNEGWDQVRSTFEQVGSLASAGHVRLSDQLIRVGTDMAYEVGVEEGEATLGASGSWSSSGSPTSTAGRAWSGRWSTTIPMSHRP